jgi:hypothetical protein
MVAEGQRFASTGEPVLVEPSSAEPGFEEAVAANAREQYRARETREEK